MIEIPDPSPMPAPENLECDTRKKPPCIQWISSVMVHLPPGPIGPGLVSPSNLHEPAIQSSCLSSGAGLGIGICAATVAAILSSTLTATNSFVIRVIASPFAGALGLMEH